MPRTVHIKKGLDVPISGVPIPEISDGPEVKHVALVGDDYIGMRPTMEVAAGDQVRRGQLLFTDKKSSRVRYTAPASGRVTAVVRGAKRKFEAVVIEIEGDERIEFDTFGDRNLVQLAADEVRDKLLEAGLWPALRSRPYSKVANPDEVPHALFVTAIDTNPLAADPRLALEPREADFIAGLQALSVLTDGKTYLCRGPGAAIPGEDLSCVETVVFDGPHPAGLPGTHIHFLAPVAMDRSAWYINYQDVLAVGHLFLTGQIDNGRILSLAGPATANPRVIRSQIGANLTELTANEVQPELEFPARVVSGSVLGGRSAAAPVDFLGRYHLQVTMLEEGRRRDLMGWAGPGFNKFSVKPIFAGVLAGKLLNMTTSTEGSHRAIVPIGMYERVMPLDIIPTPLLKSLAVQDVDTAQSLGCLELDEEDLSLCTFVCPGKIEYGPLLRESLQTIEAEG